MTRYLPLFVLVAVLAAIADITPGAASADDAAVVTSAVAYANNDNIQLKNASVLIRKVS